MKIGVRFHDLDDTDFDAAIKFCHDYQVEGVQLAPFKTCGTDSEKIKELFLKLKENNIEIFVLGAYFNFVHPDPKQVQMGIDRFNKVHLLAQENGLYVATETGSVNGEKWTYNCKNHDLSTFKKVDEIIATKLLNDRMLIEPVFDHVVYDINRVDTLLKTNDKIGLVFDICNLLNYSNYEDYLYLMEEYLIRFSNKIKVLHFKNFIMVETEKKACGLADGFLDYAKILKLVKKYLPNTIPVIVEELQDIELIDSIKYLKKLEK